jgi:hypothetical protein
MSESFATGPEPTQEDPPREPRRSPWLGRKRVLDAKEKFIAVRCTSADRDRIETRAGEAGLSVGAFLRAAALGSAGPRAVRRPRVERADLARLLGKIGNLQGNVNQVAKFCNATRTPADARTLDGMKADILDMRAELMRALGREP